MSENNEAETQFGVGDAGESTGETIGDETACEKAYANSKLLFFANDLPSQEKWKGAMEVIAVLTSEELQAEKEYLVTALQCEVEASELGCGDYKVYYRLIDLGEAVEERIAEL